MKGKVLFLIFLLVLLFVLFLTLYLLGFMNLFMQESFFFQKYKWLDFGKPIITIFYLIILSIFFIVVVSIMFRLIVSFKNDNIKLTSANIEDFSIATDENSDPNEKLSGVIDKNINAINNYSRAVDKDMDKISKYEDEMIFQEKIDAIYQNFSQMTSEILQSIDISELFEKILFWGAGLSHSKRGSLMVVDKNRELYIYKTMGWSLEEKKKIKDIKIPLGSGIAGKVASENKRIFVTNIENYEGHDFKFKEKYETKSFISLPIFGMHRVVAVLNLTDNQNGYYSTSDLEGLNIITSISSKIFELIQFKKRGE